MGNRVFNNDAEYLITSSGLNLNSKTAFGGRGSDLTIEALRQSGVFGGRFAEPSDTAPTDTSLIWIDTSQVTEASPTPAVIRHFVSATSTWEVVEFSDIFLSGTGTQNLVTMTRLELTSEDIDADVKFIQSSGYSAFGDRGEAFYKRVDSEPSHEGKFRSTDRFLSNGTADPTNGGWWEIVLPVTANAFGFSTSATAVDNRTALRNAIAFIESQGGGTVYVRSGSYNFASGTDAMIQASNTVVEGERKATFLNVTGSDDTFLIQDTSSNTELNSCAVWDITFNESSKTGGNCVNARRVSEFILGRCKLDQPFKGCEFHNFNNLQIWDTRIVNARDSYHWLLTGGGTADTPIYGSELRSDVVIFQSTESGGTFTSGVSDIIIDGFVHSIDINGHHSVAPGSIGLHARNTIGASNFCQFIRADGLQVDGPGAECVRLDVGQDLYFNNCIFSGSRNNNNVVMSNGVKMTTFTGCRSNNAALSGFFDDGDGTNIIGCKAHSNSSDEFGGSLNTAFGIDIGNNSTNAIVIGNVCGDAATASRQFAGINIASGADDFLVAFNNCFNQATQGIQLGATLDSSKRLFQNLGADNSQTIFREDFDGSTDVVVINNNTGANVRSGLVGRTGTSNSSFAVQLIDNNGTPRIEMDAGTAITRCNYFDLDEHVFRSGAGAERFRIQSNGAIRLQAVSGLNSGNTSSGDIWIDSATSNVQVNLGGTVYNLDRTAA